MMSMIPEGRWFVKIIAVGYVYAFCLCMLWFIKMEFKNNSICKKNKSSKSNFVIILLCNSNIKIIFCFLCCRWEKWQQPLEQQSANKLQFWALFTSACIMQEHSCVMSFLLWSHILKVIIHVDWLSFQWRQQQSYSHNEQRWKPSIIVCTPRQHKYTDEG